MADDAMTIDSKESTAAPELLSSTTNTATSSSSASVANDPNDPDPITASYNIFLNPDLPLGRRLLVLQQPNRTDNVTRAAPTELRVKSQAGMVEVDMPMNTGAAYDREKGLDWGRKLKNSLNLKNGGTHGLAGGFGSGATTGGRGKKKGEDDDDVGIEWNDAVRQDKVLRTQTLGGQYPVEREVQYMVGVFQGKDLHLTPVSSLIHLRPQLHHIDASTHLERHAASKEASGGAGGAAGAGTTPAARAIHMTVKATADGNSDGNSTETMADRLRNVQAEGWRRMRYTDENEEAAWDVYNESMFLRPDASNLQTSAAPTIGSSEDKGKEKATDGAAKLQDIVGTFEARWDEKKLLESVSGIIKPEDQAQEQEKVEEVKKEPEPVVEAPKRGASVRGRGAARGRGRGRGRGA